MTTYFRDATKGKGWQYVLILLNPGMIRPLLDTTTSDTEKALSRFNFAKTVSLPLVLSVVSRLYLLNLK